MPAWARLIIGAAAARVLLALGLYLSSAPADSPAGPAPTWVFAALSATFLVVGLGLAFGSRQDARAAWLGGVFLLVAAPLATPLLGGLQALGPLQTPVRWRLFYLRPEAFVGGFLWQFVMRFPADLSDRSAVAARVAAIVASAAGAVAAIANLAAGVLGAGALPSAWGLLLVTTRPGLFWPLTLAIAATAFLFLAGRVWFTAREYQWEVRLFSVGLLAGLLPFALEVIAEQLIPPYRAFAHSAAVEPRIGILIFGALSIVPFVTAYSVLFDRVVDVRIVLQMALQYALARYTIAVAALVPFAALVAFLFEHRQEPLATIMSAGPRPAVLTGVVIGCLAALRLRSRWLEALDRRYFREPYDSRQVLTDFVGELPTTNTEELANGVSRDLDRALHASVDVFFVDGTRTTLNHVGGRLAPLSVGSTLVGMVSTDPLPMDVDLAGPASPWRRLPDSERQWLREGGFSLLVLVRGTGGSTAGVLALSPKRSRLPFSAEDRRLLSAVASATGLAFDSIQLRLAPQPASEPPARECRSCSRLSPSESVRCSCGGDLVPAAVPRTLRGVFRLEERVGAGSMGVVYRAMDLNLGREVAIKALPRITPREMARLRREARAMAAVAHPHLAVVHGIETWQGVPFLIQEYLSGGTLAHRLSVSRLAVRQALELGVTLAETLDYVHRAGVVHLDIKPSNIGFTRDSVVKLFDFGLARALDQEPLLTDGSTREARSGDLVAIDNSTLGIAGTPAFMSPEAVRGAPPAPSFDIWALTVVLYEAMAGRRPFEGREIESVLARVSSGPAADIRDFHPGAPESLAAFFRQGLSLDPSQRPPSAAALGARLHSLLADIRMG